MRIGLLGVARPLALMVVLGTIRFAVAEAQTADIGRALCYDIEKTINALATFTTTSCFPAKGKAAGAVSLLILSDQPVFDDAKARKGWLLIAVAAVGSSLNDRPEVRADEVLFSDAVRTQSRIGYVLQAATAKMLQRKVKSEQIGIDAMYAAIERELVRREVRR